MNLGKSMAAVVPSSSASWKSVGDAVSDQFPAGLRVLVVDDDPTCLRILEKMLRNCLYEVTKCNRAEIALKLLRDNKNGYDVVISDVHMPDMDGFKLLEQVGLEMDLPVIMMSADDSKNVVMKGVTHGACDYLIKPVRMEALKNIWQHVVRKKKHEWKEKDFEQTGSVEDGERQQKPPLEDVDYSSSANEGSWKNPKKRKDDEEDQDERDDSSTLKKPRVVWSVELHQQFVAAVNQLGIDKAVPKRILELMNVAGLTRENVASHLQKYRLYLRRLSGVSQHQNELGNSFMASPEAPFGSISSINGLDFQALAASGQIPAQSLASLHAAAIGRPNSKPAISMPVVDQRNLFSFETPKRFGDGQQLLNGNNKQINLLHGIPTNMEPKQLASLNQSARTYSGLSMQVSPHANQGNSLLVQMSQPHSRVQMLNENTASQLLRLPSSLGQSILSNEIPSGALGRNGIVDGVRGPIYTPVSQASSLVDFSMSNGAGLSRNTFTPTSDSRMPSLTSKGMTQDELNSEVNKSRGFPHSYDMFSELQQHKVQNWGLQNVGSTFGGSQHSGLDVSPSALVQPGFSSSKKSQSRIGEAAIFSSGEGGQNHPPNFGQQFNSFTMDNSLRIKSERLPDASCQTNLLPQQFGQDDLMSALLKQESFGSAVDSDFGFDGYALDNLPV